MRSSVAGLCISLRSTSRGNTPRCVIWTANLCCGRLRKFKRLRGYRRRASQWLQGGGRVVRWDCLRIGGRFMGRLDRKSRMSGDVHVWFREHPTGRFPRVTRLVVQRSCDLKSRMRQSRTSGSVGGPGAQAPSSTRLGGLRLHRAFLCILNGLSGPDSLTG